MAEKKDDEFLKKYGYVCVSSYRINAIKSLDEGVKMPSNLAKDIGIRTNHISKVLTELKQQGLAECVNEEAHKGRIYRLTDEGKEMAQFLK